MLLVLDNYHSTTTLLCDSTQRPSWLEARPFLGQATGHTAQTCWNLFLPNMAWSATAFQFVLDLVKRWWLDGFAAWMVNGQLAIACPLHSHTPCPYITAYMSNSCIARAWPTVHPGGWHRIQHEDRVEAQRAGRTHYHLFVAQEDRMEIER